MQWSIEQPEASGSPVYLESTVEVADFYEKAGLTAGEIISLPIRVEGGTEAQIYREIIFTYYPTLER